MQVVMKSSQTGQYRIPSIEQNKANLDGVQGGTKAKTLQSKEPLLGKSKRGKSKTKT